MIVNHFRLIPHRVEASVTASVRLETSTRWEKTEKAALCVLPVFHTHITHVSVCQPYENLFMLPLTSNACTLPTVSLTLHSRRQQLPPSPLSPPCLSLSHMHREEGTDSHLPSHIYPFLYSSQSWDTYWLATIISKQTHPQIYCFPISLFSCPSSWKRLNVNSNHISFSIQFPFIIPFV